MSAIFYFGILLDIWVSFTHGMKVLIL